MGAQTKVEIAIKGASGLGDNIYLYPIARHFSKLYDTVHLMTKYPAIFESIPNVVCHRHLKLNHIMIGKRKKDIDLRVSYGPRKHKPGTSQFEDSYIYARETFKYDIPDLKLTMPWEIKNTELHNTIKMLANKAGGRKVAVIAAPYQPFGREDKWGDEIKIDPNSIKAIAEHLKLIGYLCVIVGNKFCLADIEAECNLVDKTSVEDLFDLAYMSDICVTQVGNLLPIAEAFGKKNITIFSHKIPKCEHKFLRAITPEKVVHHKNINLSMNDNNIDIDKVNNFIKE